MITQLISGFHLIYHAWIIQPHLGFVNADKLFSPNFFLHTLHSTLRRKGTLEKLFLFIKLFLVAKKKGVGWESDFDLSTDIQIWLCKGLTWELTIFKVSCVTILMKLSFYFNLIYVLIQCLLICMYLDISVPHNTYPMVTPKLPLRYFYVLC